MRGYQRRVIYLKNTGSKIFDEAYFVIKGEENGQKENIQMVDEANRIIEESFGKGDKKKRKNRILLSLLFSLGVVAGILVCLLFVSIFT